MYRATKDVMLATTITGSLPRPRWYTESLGSRGLLEALASADFREQYMDAVSTFLRDQEVAGLDIVTDGDCRFDNDVGGQSWSGYLTHHMGGYDLAHPHTPARRTRMRTSLSRIVGSGTFFNTNPGPAVAFTSAFTCANSVGL